MNCTVIFSKFLFSTMLLTSLITSCRKSDEAPTAVVSPGDSTSSNPNADPNSNHLLFATASKNTGNIPAGPGGSSLKLSFSDTFYLFDEIKRPIKILHLDTTKHVSGVSIQV